MLKQLVLTKLKLEKSYSDDVVFLGDWCHSESFYRKSQTLTTQEFHWNDRNKLKKDYDYLQDLHSRLLNSIARSFNLIHGKGFDSRYWQILLDPWLLSYVGVMYDRWETLRNIFDQKHIYKVRFISESDTSTRVFDYNEHIDLIETDIWNQLVYQDIIKKNYNDQVVIEYGNNYLNEKKIQPTSNASPFYKIVPKLLHLFDKILSLLFNKYHVVFIDSNFDRLSLALINLSLRQIPRSFISEFSKKNILKMAKMSQYNYSFRENLNFQFECYSDFEKYLISRLHHDIPTMFIESYNTLYTNIDKIKLKTKSIMTSSAHWNNVLAKFWIAKCSTANVKIVISEHGGSIPAYKELFDFEENISDFKCTWFLPYHEKHCQLPATKLIRIARSKFIHGDHLTVIGGEVPRWVHRCHFYPMSSQCLVLVDMVIKLYNALPEKVKSRFRIKPYTNVGWNTHEIFLNNFDKCKILSDMSINSAFQNSKIILCTYPETTFSEAMSTNLPTILLFPNFYYERNDVALGIIKILLESKIIFYDSISAANHIKLIWDDPLSWWDSRNVLDARKEFNRVATLVSSDWKQNWINFFTSI